MIISFLAGGASGLGYAGAWYRAMSKNRTDLIVRGLVPIWRIDEPIMRKNPA